MANETARNLRKRMTPQDVKLWVRVRELRRLGYHFRRQSPSPPYILDFECRRAKLVVEVDGGQHGRSDMQLRDQERDKHMEHSDFTVLRFWNNEIDNNLDGVMDTIVRELEAKYPTRPLRGHPPHDGEG
ncbi:MAG TPA: endonuclease domain-containing protein [Rhizobiales bacterium]|nr:hypothetical protein BMS3Bbin10_02689 [bacterium BMS3Bbin10]HDO51454.1 endonuclease domain-containing protein [Hyphomicrobiales bacterium]